MAPPWTRYQAQPTSNKEGPWSRFRQSGPVGEDGVPEYLRRPEYTERDLANQQALPERVRRSQLGIGDHAANLATMALDTVPFYDEGVGGANALVAGAMAAPGALMRGKPGEIGQRMGQTYRSVRDGLESSISDAEALGPTVTQPIKGTAYGLQGLVPFNQANAFRGAMTSAARPVATTLLGKTGRVLETAGRGGALGMGYGAIAGAGEGDTADERLAGMLTGAGGGFAAGAGLATAGKYVLPPIVQLAMAAGRKIAPGPERRAVALVERAMKRDGLSWDDLTAAQGSMARQGGATRETLAEVGPYAKGRKDGAGSGMRRLARAVHAIPGKASSMADDLFAKRRKAMHGDMQDAVTKGTGQKIADSADDLIALQRRQKAANDQAYETFRQGGINEPVFAQRLEPMLRSERGRQAMLTAADAADSTALTLKARGDPRAQAAADEARTLRQYAEGGNQIPSPGMLDETIRAMDDQIDAAGGHRVYSGGQIYSLQKSMREALGDATDGRYMQAMGGFSEGRILREAIDAGYDAFRKPAHEMELFLGGFDKDGRVIRNGPLTPDQRESFLNGFGRAVSEAIDRRDVSALRRLTEDHDLEKKLREVMGDMYAPFMKRINRIMRQKSFADYVGQGSQTARIQQDVADVTDDGDAFSRALDDMSASGGGVGLMGALQRQLARPVIEKASEVYRGFRYPGAKDERVNKALGDMLFTPMQKQALAAIRARVDAAKAPVRVGRPGEPIMDATAAVGGLSGGGAAAATSPEVQDYEGQRRITVSDAVFGNDLRVLDPATPDRERQALLAQMSPERRAWILSRLQREQSAGAEGASR